MNFGYDVKGELYQTQAISPAGAYQIFARPTALQTGGNIIRNNVLKALGLTKQEAHEAMEDLKSDEGLSPDYHQTKILSNCDVVDSDSGKVYGNLYHYVTGDAGGSW